MKYLTLLLSLIMLFGCDKDNSFNRVIAINNYGAMYFPNSQYIKNQAMMIETDGKIAGFVTKQYNAQGLNLVSESTSEFQNRNSKLTFDYSHKTVDFYSSRMDINMKGGKLIFDDKNRLIGGIGSFYDSTKGSHDDLVIKQVFDEDKLILTELRSDNILIYKKNIWKNDLVVKVETLWSKKGIPPYSEEIYFEYDRQGRNTRIEMTMAINNVTLTSNATFSNYNQYGDWTQATIVRQGQKEPSIVTREIEYF